ncbi:MAG: deoxynucleoside kinase [bacterium]|nr:deoxynucleoside kinase [bacterium]
MKTTYVVISGPICAGKDELINKLKERNLLEKNLQDGEQVHYLSEAVNHDKNVLNGYYSDQKGTGEFFDLGTLCFRTVLTSTIKNKKGIVIGNRHPLEARATFIRYGGENNFLDATSIGLHDIVLRRGIEKKLIPIPELVFYLDVADPEILIERNKSRQAPGEENLMSEYLRNIAPYFGRYRDNFQEMYQQFSVPTPELKVLDSSTDYKQDPKILEKLAEICEREILSLHRRRNEHS